MKYNYIVTLLVLLVCLANASFDDPFYDFRGFNPTRESYGYEPQEYLDPFTGSFCLVYTDIHLPGNGNLDLNIVRAYNSDIYRDWEQPQIEAVPVSWVGFGWSLHMGRLVFPNGWPPQDPDYAYLILPDGSNHTFYRRPDLPLAYISKEYWLLQTNANGWEVVFTDGVKWKFNALVFGSWTEGGGNPILYYPTVEIMDATDNNRIQISYTHTGSNEAVMTEIIDACSRHVYFYMDGTDNLQRIVANGKTYRFEYTDSHIADYKLMLRVKYPEDQGAYSTYQYDYRNESVEYDGEMISRTNPWGMIYYYGYTYHSFNIGGQQYLFRVLMQRQTMTGTTWNIYYAQANTDEDSTRINGPYHYTVFKMYGYNMIPQEGDNWKIGLILSKKIGVEGTCPLYVKWTYDYSPSQAPVSLDRYYGPETYDNGVFVPLVSHLNIEEYSRSDGSIQYTAYYDTHFDSYDSYGNCLEMREYSGQTSGEDEDAERGLKSTTCVYWYNPNRNIVHSKIQHLDMYYSDAPGPHHIEDYTYFDNGKLNTAIVDGVAKTYAYDTFFPNKWNLKQVTDEMMRFIRYSHYNYGVPDQIQNGVYTINRTINWEGTIASETNGHGYTTSYQYDNQNRLTRVSPPGGNNPTIITYGADNTMKKTSRGPSWTDEYYDNYGRLDRTVNSEGVKTEYTFNTYGWLTYKSLPFTGSNEIGINYSYDYIGRLKSRVLPGHWTETFHHYNGGDPIMVYKDQTWWEGHHMRYMYRTFGSPFGNLFLSKVYLFYQNNVLMKIVDYAYNNAGKIIRLRWNYSEYQREFEYYPGNISLLYKERSPERGETEYIYEANGNLLRRKDADLDITYYAYDNANRLSTIDYPGVDYDVTYTYDNANNLEHISTPSVEHDYMFDEMNRCTQDLIDVGGQIFQINYQYDGNSNLTFIHYPNMTLLQYTYDTENRVQTIPGFITQPITYHASGSASSYSLDNGCATSVTFHDDRYLVKRITVNPSIMDEEYVYDQSANLINSYDHISPSNNQDFIYDDFHRLLNFNGPWGSGSYTYENLCLGRRINEIIGASAASYYYDVGSTERLAYTQSDLGRSDFFYSNNGNIKGITGPKALAIKYDYENRPVSITNRVTNKEVEYDYDGNGQRVKKITPWSSPGIDNENNRWPKTYHYFITAPWGDILYEQELPPFGFPIERNYVYLNGKLLAVVKNGIKYYYHCDHLGTPKAMTNTLGTKIYEWLGYPFGKEYSSSVAIDNNRRFTGKEFEEFNELYYFGVRFYNPDFGIFMTPEPFVGADGFNLEDPFSLKFYDYCRNNPLKYFDPSGEYYLTQREGVFYVYRIPTIEAEARFALSFIPGASVLISLVRLASSDETLGQKDWAWAAAETATGLAGGSFLVSMIKYQCLHSILEIFARKTLSNSAYEMTSEYERALYLDDQIFRRLIRENEEYQLKAIDRGGNGGRVEINLGNSREDYSILKERLMKIAEDEAKWWLNLPPHNK